MRLLVIFGPPAVGKMTVGRAVTACSGFRLFHNHAVLEPLLEVFDYGTPPFMRLLGQWRRRVIEEAAAAGIDLVVTFVWGLEREDDVREVRDYIGPYVARRAAVSFVELYADLDTRLDRNRTEHRLGSTADGPLRRTTPLVAAPGRKPNRVTRRRMRRTPTPRPSGRGSACGDSLPTGAWRDGARRRSVSRSACGTQRGMASRLVRTIEGPSVNADAGAAAAGPLSVLFEEPQCLRRGVGRPACQQGLNAPDCGAYCREDAD